MATRPQTLFTDPQQALAQAKEDLASRIRPLSSKESFTHFAARVVAIAKFFRRIVMCGFRGFDFDVGPSTTVDYLEGYYDGHDAGQARMASHL